MLDELSLHKAKSSGPFGSDQAAVAAGSGAWVTGSSVASIVSGGVQSMSPPCWVSWPLPRPELMPAHGVVVGAVPAVSGHTSVGATPIMKAVVRHSRSNVPLPGLLEVPAADEQHGLARASGLFEQSSRRRSGCPSMFISNEEPVPRLMASVTSEWLPM